MIQLFGFSEKSDYQNVYFKFVHNMKSDIFYSIKENNI